MKRLLPILLLLLSSTLAFGAAGDAPRRGSENANPPAEIRGMDNPSRIPDQYIVVFKWGEQHAQARANELAAAHGAQVMGVYEHAIKGFAMRGSEQAARAIARNPNVDFVEADQTISAGAVQSPVPSWGLDRVDQRVLPLNNSYTFNFNGAGVHVYIIDTGIRSTHTDFGGRVALDFTAINDGNGASDCNGHGTHVAGSAGAATYGVAKNVTLHAVRVLDCAGSGSNSGVISGVDFVTANHLSPAVANMSLGGGASTALDNAVNNSVASGVFYAVAAGNENANACNSSPARAANAYTVAASTSSDQRASFSNFGACVDVFAPGLSITSTWSTSNTATNTISGTSMASPHVAGAAALVRAQNPGLTPTQVAQTLTANATSGKLTSIGTGSPNLLLFTLTSGGGGPTVVYSENFDAGTASGWNKSTAANDLWRVSSDCVTAKSGSFTISFSRAAPNCDYDAGTVSGWARSPRINLSGFASATLTFNHFWQTESFSSAFDIMRIQASTDDGATWTTIKQIDSRNPNPSGFLAESLDVTSFRSANFRVRLFFDSVDGTSNDFLGWYVDDVKVTVQ